MKKILNSELNCFGFNAVFCGKSFEKLNIFSPQLHRAQHPPGDERALHPLQELVGAPLHAGALPRHLASVLQPEDILEDQARKSAK